jgi:hypothetical protein
MITIYVLKCSNNKYYIGKTLSDVNKRFNIHKKGQGAIWTRKHRPVEILNVYKNCDHFDEDKYTKIYMDKYGIENVRGGSYTKIKLDDDVIKFLEKELSSIHDKCYGCGSKKHFIKTCPKIYTNLDSNSDDDVSSSSSNSSSSYNSNDSESNSDYYSDSDMSSCSSSNSYYDINKKKLN